MRNKLLAVSLFAVVLAVILSVIIESPAFAAGDDKPATPPSPAMTAPAASPVPTAVRPDRQKKVFTNDDIDQMWPKEQAATNVAPVPAANASTAVQARRSVAVSRAARATIVPLSPDQDPVRYAAQMEALNAELDSISSREASLRDFRATGTGPGLTIGLQFYAPCDGITTDNAIAQLELRRREIEQQIDELAGHGAAKWRVAVGIPKSSRDFASGAETVESGTGTSGSHGTTERPHQPIHRRAESAGGHVERGCGTGNHAAAGDSELGRQSDHQSNPVS